MPTPSRVAQTICKPSSSLNAISPCMSLVPNVIQNAITTPETMEIDSKPRSVPRRFGGEISEI